MNNKKQFSELVYIANARLPTEKAHGYQICKMCEAFAQNGMDVLLLHPYRRQPDPKLFGQTVFDYYGVRRVFQVRTLANLDVVRIERLVPNAAFAGIFFIHALLWGLYAALLACRKKADFYYTRDSEVAYWLVRLGLPTVYEAHVVPMRGQRWLLQKIGHHRVLRLIVVLTSFIRTRFVQIGCPPDKIIVQPDAVDLGLFENLPSKQECRHRLGLPLDRTIIGYIGRFQTLEMEKGIPDLVQTMAYLPSINGAEPLLLCVGGPLKSVPAYLEVARQFGVSKRRLKFVDHVPSQEIPIWIRTFDIAVAPFPWIEHYAYFMSPLKLFEYMAAGVPIVTTDLPSIREVLRHEKNALLVEPGDSMAMALEIKRALGNIGLLEKLGEQSLLDAQKYAWKARAAKILQFLVDV